MMTVPRSEYLLQHLSDMTRTKSTGDIENMATVTMDMATSVRIDHRVHVGRGWFDSGIPDVVICADEDYHHRYDEDDSRWDDGEDAYGGDADLPGNHRDAMGEDALFAASK